MFAVVVAACGGGSGGEPTSDSTASATAAHTTASSASTASTASTAPAADGPVYYFSDCAAGAQAGCVPGDNANAGTSPASPKRTLVGFNVNSLPAGAQLLFARGGAWTDFRVALRNLNATPDAPIVLDSYQAPWGGSAAPWLKVQHFVGIEFGEYNDTANDGGYTVRNLKLDGEGVSRWGVWLRTTTRNITLDNLEITGFDIGVHAVNEGATGNTAFTLRNSRIHHNEKMGWLGSANDALIEGNTFEGNNVTGSTFDHAIYLGSGSRESRNITVRGNVFRRNSVVNGRCTGGNVTAHGQFDGLVFENNVIEQDASDGGCYGFSIGPSYDTAEWFRNTVVRGNTVINLGNCAICVASAPGVVIENNLVVNSQEAYHAAVAIPIFPRGTGDDADRDATVRNNTAVYTRASAWNEAIVLRAAAGSGLRVVSNLVYYGSASHATSACFGHGALTNFTTLDYNLCHHARGTGLWSQTYSTIAAARALGVEANSLTGDPLFEALPSAANNWSEALQSASPARRAAHRTLSSARDRLGAQRTEPSIGSRE